MRWLALALASVLSVCLAPSLASAFCDPPNLLIILDRSGSMLQDNKWSDAKTAITTVTSASTTQVRFGLVTFSDDASLDAPIPSNAAAIQTALNQLQPLGQTFMVKALTLSTTHLTAVLAADAQQGRPTYVVFLTDGEPSDRCPGAEVTALRSLVAKGLTYDIKTYVIGFGSLVNPVCLNDLATRGGTALPGSIKYYVATNAADLTQAMQTIITDATNNSRQEVCDGKDNDCDGKVDEKLTRSCTNQTCRGTETCAAGQWAGCTAPAPTAEICDNKDNDCDGKTDEGLTQACQNNCGSGSQACSSGQWSACNAQGTRPCQNNCGAGTETCRNDAWSACDAQGSRPCQNACGTGSEICQNNTWLVCNPAPKTETCNNKDDDCDGQTDEGLSRACCGGGTQTCAAGQWGACGGSQTQAEICNNRDDDCDGKTDEGLTQACQNNCGSGVATCSQGRWINCDAQGTRACQTACGSGTETCRNNAWGSCTATKPTAEICDGADNDCDGKTDEGLIRSCGTCKSQICAAGQWGVCTQTQQGAPEECNKLDDDCDGKIDEGLTQACTKGTCTGSQVCTNGAWGTCSLPKETCNDLDDDCDGKIDEGFADKGKPCGAGQGICYRTALYSCKPDASGTECKVQLGTPVAEICDARDNDCDGKTDESLVRDCAHACGPGSQICLEGSWTACKHKQGTTPQKEVCDGKDNDCDGKTDEGCSCIDGESRGCGSAIGECKEGTQICVGGQWDADCKGKIEASAEVCDGKDNDCDARVDEELERTCKTPCGEGRQQCIQGDWSTCTAPNPRPEICNGQDDDCDGFVDEGAASCSLGSQCVASGCRPPCRNGECPRGQQCEDGVCVGKICLGVTCSDGYSCENGRCEDACLRLQCPVSTVCRQARCLPSNCYAYGCEQGKHCVDGKCEADLCASVSCKDGEFCRVGKCARVCDCKPGEVCQNDLCVSNPCSDATCSGDRSCREGICEKRCPIDACHGGQYCKEGSCIHDPCVSVICPSGFVCRAGQCTNQPQDPNPGPPSEATAERPSDDGGHRSEPSNDTSGETTSPEGASPDVSLDIPSSHEAGEHSLEKTKSDLGAPESVSEGSQPSPGCGCSQSPEPSWLALLLFLPLLRRRFR